MALLLGVLATMHSIQLWMLFAIATAIGVVLAVDTPTRQSFVTEMVGGEGVQNAVSLNSVLINASRAVGPAVAGGPIATVGVGALLRPTSGSFLAVLISLALLRTRELHPSVPLGAVADSCVRVFATSVRIGRCSFRC